MLYEVTQFQEQNEVFGGEGCMHVCPHAHACLNTFACELSRRTVNTGSDYAASPGARLSNYPSISSFLLTGCVGFPSGPGGSHSVLPSIYWSSVTVLL